MKSQTQPFRLWMRFHTGLPNPTIYSRGKPQKVSLTKPVPYWGEAVSAHCADRLLAFFDKSP